MEVSGEHHAPAALPPVSIEEEVGWAPGSAWTGAGKSCVEGWGLQMEQDACWI